MNRTVEEVRQRVAALPGHVKDDIICGVAWNMFGDTDIDDKVKWIYLDQSPYPEDLKDAANYLRDELNRDRSDLMVKEVIRSGELEIEQGHTIKEIVELAGEYLDRANTWDICGEILFLGNDDRYYVGTVEFVVAPGASAYVEDVLNGNEEEEDDDGSAPCS